MLNLTQVGKALPNGRQLFTDLELAVAPGECVAILGESGVGKSTLLNLIAGLDEVDAGQIRIAGQVLGELDDDGRSRLRRHQIGFVFQAFHILPHLTLEQNVALSMLLIDQPAAAAREAACEALAAVGLAGRASDYPRQISGGELQRVAIARALVHSPALLLADEPTGNLDPDNAARVLELMNRLMRAKGSAMVLVTHSEATAAIADRRLRLTVSGLASA